MENFLFFHVQQRALNRDEMLRGALNYSISKRDKYLPHPTLFQAATTMTLSNEYRTTSRRISRESCTFPGHSFNTHDHLSETMHAPP